MGIGNRHQNNNIWYMKSPLGKNEISNFRSKAAENSGLISKFLSKAAENAGLQRDGGKLSNHSVRKTSISRLLDANTPEIFVAQLSGHKNLQANNTNFRCPVYLAEPNHQQKTNQEEHSSKFRANIPVRNPFRSTAVFSKHTVKIQTTKTFSLVQV
jgi:hypothetical protein